MSVTYLRPAHMTGRFVCEHSALASALATVGLALTPRPRISALGCVLLEGHAGGLRVTASTGETAVSVQLPAASAEFGAVLLDHRELSKLLTALLKGRRKAELAGLRATVSFTDGAATLSLAGHTVPLTTYPLTNFPQPPMQPSTVATVDRCALARNALRVLKAASDDEMLPMLCGIKLDIGDGIATLAATDRFRLAVANMPALTARRDRGGCVLPAKLFAAATKRFTDDRVRIGLSTGGARSAMTLACGDTTITAQSITEDYVPYERLLDVHPAGAAVVNRRELAVHAERAAAVTAAKGEPGREIDVAIDPLGISVVPVLSEEPTAVSAPRLDADVLDLVEPITVRCKSQYLLDAIAGFDADVITLHPTTGNRPLAFTDTPNGLTEHAEFRHLVMPIRRTETQEAP